ncbi:MAG TPA: hypothetical protein VHL52_07225 [Acidimicrobiia bacterium]|nr:hypothetical protein [Acidimicrobiia bacterium]
MSQDSSRRRTWIVGLAIAVAMVPALAFGAHPEGDFEDVPDDHLFHGDIQWMHDSGVTRGCNPPENDEYCPDEALTRAQEAAFFHRYDTFLRDSLEPRLVPDDCEAGQIAEFDGEGWVCADRVLDGEPPAGGELTVAAGEPVEVAPGGSATATASCAEGEVALSGTAAPLTSDVTIDSTTIEGADVTVEVTNANVTDAATVTAYAICTSA